MPFPHTLVPRQKRKVRIVGAGNARRTATLSLLATSGVALLLLIIWRIWRSEPEVEIPRRTLNQVTLKWRCDAGHEYRARGQLTSRACPHCGRASYPVDVYECEVHGRYIVTARFDPQLHGRPTVVELRLPGKDWVSSATGLRCPRCNRLMSRSRNDPLVGMAKKKRRTKPKSPGSK